MLARSEEEGNGKEEVNIEWISCPFLTDALAHFKDIADSFSYLSIEVFNPMFQFTRSNNTRRKCRCE